MKTSLTLIVSVFIAQAAFSETLCFEGSNGTSTHKEVQRSAPLYPNCDDGFGCQNEEEAGNGKINYTVSYLIFPQNAKAERALKYLRSTDLYHCYSGTIVSTSGDYDNGMIVEFHAFDVFSK